MRQAWYAEAFWLTGSYLFSLQCDAQPTRASGNRLVQRGARIIEGPANYRARCLHETTSIVAFNDAEPQLCAAKARYNGRYLPEGVLQLLNGQHVVIVGGCGHVGLPLGIALASRGLSVTLLDIDQAKVNAVNDGKMPFMETGAEAVLQKVLKTNLAATLNPECLRTAGVVITVVGTPVDRHLNPTVHELYKSIDSLLDYIADGTLLILRSTVSPGVTNLVYQRIRSLGRDIDLAFCPERIAEGNAMEELVKLPQIVSAFQATALQRASEVFLCIAPSVIELTPLEAELAKLFTNSWRYLNFAISNQFYMLAETYGLDFYRIHDAVRRDYPRMRSFATAGFAAGPAC